MASNPVRTADAKNRSVRTFLTGLAIDVGVGVALVLTTFFVEANAWGDLEWALLAFSLFKSAAQAVGAYILRQFLDPSKLPTPLPPATPGGPAAPAYREVGHEYGRVSGTAILIWCLALTGVLILVFGFILPELRA